MDISIDMLSVGNADSIIVWAKDRFSSSVILIDGGNPGDGEKVIDHLNNYVLKPAQKKAPDLIIATHSDKDHIGGLSEVVDYYGSEIGQFWGHDPRNHTNYASYKLTTLKTLDETALTSNAREAVGLIYRSVEQKFTLLDLVDSYGIPRSEPFYLCQYGGFLTVLGPTPVFYKELLPEFRNFESHLLEEIALKAQSLDETDFVGRKEDESPCPIVDETDECSAENESSVVLQILIEDRRYLFTADAGVRAFTDISNRVDLSNIYWLDIPHHGSRRNLTSDLISTMSPEIAYVSAKGNRKHPRRALVNCFKRHNTAVYSTHRSGSLWHHRGNFPERANYSTAEPL